MSLPDFNEHGDLPEGIHRVALSEVLTHFGTGSRARAAATDTLARIFDLAAATMKLRRFIVFGSYVTSKLEPKDVDIIMVMADDFTLSACDEQTRSVFDHQSAEKLLNASVFWLVPSVVFRESLDEFIAHWGIKRDMTRRGIVEVIYDPK